MKMRKVSVNFDSLLDEFIHLSLNRSATKGCGGRQGSEVLFMNLLTVFLTLLSISRREGKRSVYGG